MRLLLADERGVLYEHPRFFAAGLSGGEQSLLRGGVNLPHGSRLMSMPGWNAVGWDPDSGTFREVEELKHGSRWKRVWAVAAVPPPGFLRLQNPAALRTSDAPLLPLWAYTAAGADKGGISIAALRVDMRRRWDTVYYETPRLAPSIKRLLERHQGNRLLGQLARCASEYQCSTASNLFLRRFEAALPVARGCNSRCIGCISKAHEKHPCSQERIGFRPSSGEAVELAFAHLRTADDPIVSFGQGCEGEPLTEAGLISEIIASTRRLTDRGIFNMNTNGSLTSAFRAVVKAGLGSVRVSLNSAVEPNYRLYFRPRGYAFSDVRRTIRLASKSGLFTTLNLQVFPGVTDTPSETRAIMELCRNDGVEFIQLRNLCIDPSIYPPAGFAAEGRPMGMKTWLDAMKRELPHVGFGCYNSTPSEIEKFRSTR
jgi:pyruvate-formate lyase-activating enzyme